MSAFTFSAYNVCRIMRLAKAPQINLSR